LFAAGDVARWPDPHTGQNIRVEHWVVAERHGQVAALNMLGRKQPFATPYPSSGACITKCRAFMSVMLSSGTALAIDGSIEKRNCRVTFVRAGRTVAVVTIDRDLDSLWSEHELELIRT
jgi:NADPH-dependent 2,4-dienoyl-CoA reductase/sulfur reductase-like enzyme